MSSVSNQDAILVDDASPEDGSGASQTRDDVSGCSGVLTDTEQPVVVDDAGDADVDAPPPSPPNPDEGDACGHPRRPNDIHHTKCEPCRIKDGILLCTHKEYCHSCGLLDDETFNQMIDDREDNAKKLKQKKDRIAARKAQPAPGPQRVSPRLAGSQRTVDVRSLLQAPLPKKISPKKSSPRQHMSTLPPDPTLNDLNRFKMGVRRFCSSKGFHMHTAERALSIPEFADVPLSKISETLVYLDQPSPQVTPTQRYHSTPNRDASPAPTVRRRLPALPATPATS